MFSEVYPVKKVMKLLSVLVLMLLTAVVTFSVTYRELGAMTTDKSVFDLSVTGNKVEEINAYLDRYFIDDYEEGKLADAAAAAMITATGDRWSYYIPAEEYQKFQETMDNAYVGIGVTVQSQAGESEEGNPDFLTITEVTRNSPAYLIGIEPGDEMWAVDGTPISELGLDKTVEMVRGVEGSQVRILFRRDGKEFEETITRASVQQIVSTYTMLEDSIGYITISNFDADCAAQTLECLQQALDDGAKSLIFDVRFNTGGYKAELVQILDVLLPEGPLFRSIDYSGKEEVLHSDANCLELPMVVLVNEDTYSAAEFFAAALQEYEAATIIGSKTTGKGNFQTVMKLSDGSAINISVGKYYTPNGVSLTDTGITPDIELDLSDEEYAKLYYNQLTRDEDPQLTRAIAHLCE